MIYFVKKLFPFISAYSGLQWRIQGKVDGTRVKFLPNHNPGFNTGGLQCANLITTRSIILKSITKLIISLPENSTVKTYTDRVTDFTGTDISQLKQDFRKAMNEIAAPMTEDEKQAFIDESNNVFIMNNLIVNSVGGQNKVLYNLLYKFSAVAFVVVGVVLAYRMYK